VAAIIDSSIFISLAYCDCLGKIRWKTSPFSDIHYNTRAL